MPSENLAKIFGPTILGYSSADPDQHAIFTETMIQRDVSTFRYHIGCHMRQQKYSRFLLINM